MLQHNTNYVISTASSGDFFALFSDDQPHLLHSLSVLRSRRNDIYARRVDTAVSENIGELGDILFYPVEYPREQMPQVVRKNLFGVNVRLRA